MPTLLAPCLAAVAVLVALVEGNTTAPPDDNRTYEGEIRRSEGNVLFFFASLTIAMLFFVVVAIFVFRQRAAPPPRYGHLRRRIQIVQEDGCVTTVKV